MVQEAGGAASRNDKGRSRDNLTAVRLHPRLRTNSARPSELSSQHQGVTLALQRPPAPLSTISRGRLRNRPRKSLVTADKPAQSGCGGDVLLLGPLREPIPPPWALASVTTWIGLCVAADLSTSCDFCFFGFSSVTTRRTTPVSITSPIFRCFEA